MVRAFSRLFLVLLSVAVVAVACREGGGPTGPNGPCASSWGQWGGDPSHAGHACATGEPVTSALGGMVFDPFAAQEKLDMAYQTSSQSFDLTPHYQVPLLVGGDIYMEQKAGTYTGCNPATPSLPCGYLAWDSQVWTEKHLRWVGGVLTSDWTFASDWKPEPGSLAYWEPLFQPAVSGDTLYVPGAGGSVFAVDRHTGSLLRRITPFGTVLDPLTFVAGPLTADAQGNVFYDAMTLGTDAVDNDVRGAWLVKIAPTGVVTTASFASLVPDAPAASAPCLGEFSYADLPWPPSPAAIPPSSPCGSQRPGINVAPAVAPDGTVVTMSRAHFNGRYSYAVAANGADLSPKWHTSLRGHLADGCGVRVPSDADPAVPAENWYTDCRVGANTGVDPATNDQPAGQVDDLSTSSPVILPDGGVLYGALTLYNESRGHLFSLDSAGTPRSTFDFGWDDTPAVFQHDSTWSIVTKDNHYFSGLYRITQLSATLSTEWSFTSTNTMSCVRTSSGAVNCFNDPQHQTGFEWCINAPVVDARGTVYVNSEDGRVYAIGQGGQEEGHLFLFEAQGAAYTPIALDSSGRVFSLNEGRLTVVGQ